VEVAVADMADDAGRVAQRLRPPFAPTSASARREMGTQTSVVSAFQPGRDAMPAQ
jgi:hypothetical protein